MEKIIDQPKDRSLFQNLHNYEKTLERNSQVYVPPLFQTQYELVKEKSLIFSSS
jgi:hypothetical protein